MALKSTVGIPLNSISEKRGQPKKFVSPSPEKTERKKNVYITHGVSMMRQRQRKEKRVIGSNLQRMGRGVIACWRALEESDDERVGVGE